MHQPLIAPSVAIGSNWKGDVRLRERGRNPQCRRSVGSPASTGLIPGPQGKSLSGL